MASATITTTRTIQLSVPPDAAAGLVRSALDSRKGRVQDDPSGSVTARFGSQTAMRLLGGMFIPAHWLPTQAKAEVVATTHGSQVDLHVADAMGVGTKKGMTGKYERAVHELADHVESHLAQHAT